MILEAIIVSLFAITIYSSSVKLLFHQHKKNMQLIKAQSQNMSNKACIKSSKGYTHVLFLLLSLHLCYLAIYCWKQELKGLSRLNHNSICKHSGQALMEFIIWSVFYISLLLIILNTFNRLHHTIPSTFFIYSRGVSCDT